MSLSLTDPGIGFAGWKNRIEALAVAVAVAVSFVLMLSSGASAAAGQFRISAAEIGKEHNIALELNKSLVIELPVAVKEMVVSNPAVVSGVMRTNRRAIIQSAGLGEANILFLNGNGNPIAVVDVAVRRSSKGLKATIGRLLPGSDVQVHAMDGKLVLSGAVASAEDAERALTIARQFVENSGDVASVVEVAGARQVMLKVTVAEVQREIVKQLGINLSSTITGGGVMTQILTSPGLGGVSGVVAPNAMVSSFNLGTMSVTASMRALERRGAIRTLAEPTLTAISGSKAEFLAGGEFPIPVEADSSKITYEFKKFGVNLAFTPVVHTGGEISLELETKVSELSAEGGYTYQVKDDNTNITKTVTIPATKEREAKTSVRLPSGSTLAIAGLIEDKQRQRLNEVPGISRLPVIGALFRSRDFVKVETELLILVTPYLSESGSAADFTLPTDKLRFGGDAAAIFLGRMQELYGVGDEKQDGSIEGSVGFVLD